MLVKARYARLAGAQAPRQEKVSQSFSQIRSLYGPSIALWVDAQRDPTPSGSTVSAVNDLSGRNVAVSQVVVAKQPLKTNDAWVLDGVNDYFTTSAIALSGLQTATLVSVDQQTNSAFSYQIDVNSASPKAFLARWNNVATRNASFVSIGNVGVSNIWSTGGYNNPIVTVGTVDWAKASGSEVAITVNGTTPTTASGAAENTGTFNDSVCGIGAISTGAGTAPFGGKIWSVLVLRNALSVADAATLSKLLMQRAGLA